jgi:uncharacterized OsmC-like protein|tara:strand:+ start:30005 stop:30418 length:414 start_codon:yes stop_codon:yes gene_type:complete
MSTKINIKNLPVGYQSVISNGKHAILGDEPIPAKGTDLGFSPVELLLAGISMCKVATIRNVARRKGWEIGEVDAQLEQTAVRQPNGSFKTQWLPTSKFKETSLRRKGSYWYKRPTTVMLPDWSGENGNFRNRHNWSQ